MKQSIVYNFDAKGYDTFVIPVVKGYSIMPKWLEEAGLVKGMLEREFEVGAKQKIKHITMPKDGKLLNYIIVNLGESAKLNGDILFQSISMAYAKCKEIEAVNILVYAEHLNNTANSIDYLRRIFEAGGLLDYSFDTYKSEKSVVTIENIDYIGFCSSTDQIIREAEYCISGIKLARSLINEPPHILTPLKLAEEALEVGKRHGIKVTVLEEKDIEKLGMNTFLAVGRGSTYKPVLIVMEYEGDRDNDSKLGMAGKGLTFDTGGYSLKSDKDMLNMHDDMGGAAALLGALSVISSMKLKLNIVGVIAACENKISGGSLLPGEIIKSMSGKYIEINNTDCEGRLTLADAITYLLECHKVNRVIDIATLTGSVHTALGNNIAGIFTDDEIMRKAIGVSSLKYGEKIWELPLDEDFRIALNSDTADIKNSTTDSNVGGFPSVAAMFIKEFTDSTPWLHIDIGGVNWEKSGTAWCPTGGKGFGVKLLYGIACELEKIKYKDR